MNFPLAAPLVQCAQLPNPNNRTAINTFLKQEASRLCLEGESDLVIRETLDVTNACYNATAASCVSAIAALTFPLASRTAREIMAHTIGACSTTEVLESKADPLAADRVSDLEVVSWGLIEEFTRKVEGLEARDREMQAAAAKLIAETVANGHNRYVLRLQAKNIFAQSALWGAAAFFGTYLDGSLQTPGYFSGLAGAIAGALGNLDSRRDSTNRLASELRTKWLGILQSGDA